ncbi:hypothetical protein ACRALDRAFT_2030688 [Sodiomyces alcalophilus JCM 7366]|uniref:uncharacterized protein n=1 Tax=Sodiomyces alcalophilus JCM 7366 TaxID=591952 RepID=UPI0039B587D9
MRAALLLLQLSLWVSLSHAFFPWFPKHRCREDNICTSTKKREQVDGDARPTEDTVAVSRSARARTYPIHQRTATIPNRSSDSDSIAREIARLIAKYTGRQPQDTVPPGPQLEKRQNVYRVVKPVSATHSNSAGIYQDGSDFSYFIQAGFGSDGKKMFMLVDTGAATTWVMGSDCTSEACNLHESFGPDDSSTYEADPSGFSVKYGSGSVKGTKATDSVAVAGMVLDRYKFGVVNQTSDDFNHFPFDGILGLSLANGHTDNFLKAAMEADVLDKGLFCVFLSRSGDGPNTGEISFGSCNPDKYTGDFTYTDVGSSNGDWAIPLDSLTYNGKKAGGEQRLAYIDTGTSYVFGPKADVKGFHDNIPGASSSDGTTWKVPCDSNKTVAYTFSGVSHNVSSRDWLSRPDSNGVCTSNIYGYEVVPGAWLLGDLFLKNVYAAFDADKNRIGFATRIPVPTNDDESPDDSGNGKDDEDASDSGNTSATSPTAVSPSRESSTRNENGSEPAATTASSGPIIQPAPSLPSSQPEELGGQVTSSSPTGEAVATETDQPASAGRTRMKRVLGTSMCLMAAALAW